MPIFRRDRHLASALGRGEIDYLYSQWNNPPGLKKEHKMLIRDTRGATFLPSDQFLHWALLTTTRIGAAERHSRDLRRHMRIANDATILGHHNYTRFDPKLQPIQPPEHLLRVYTMKRILDDIVDKITFTTKFTQEYSFFGFSAVCYGNIHVVWTSDVFAYIITHTHFLAVRDCVNAWFSCLLYSYQNFSKYPGHNLYQTVSAVISVVLHDIGIYKDSTYDVLKSWQPLVIGTILKYVESRPAFLESLSEVVTNHPDSVLLRIATRPPLSLVDCHLSLELLGMTKCFGHPEVVMDESVAAWAEKGMVRKDDLEEVGELIREAFILEFSRNYFKQRRRWPVLQLTPDSDQRIRECYYGGYWGETLTDPWTPEMFKDITFRQTLSFDYQLYTADLLSDKSIIPSLRHWPYEYDMQAHRTLHGFFPTAPERQSNNGMRYNSMCREKKSTLERINTISTGETPSDWKVCVGVPKEREMKKRKARFFGKLCLEMRLYQVATENNMKTVFKYIPHQTMTKSEDSLMKHLIRMSEATPESEGSYIFISLDFSSWCTSFRYEGVTPIFQELDRLLGVENVMAYTQVFPLESILLFQDRFYPPKQAADGLPETGPRCIRGPEAWMEGLRQKGWTLATIMLILLASWRCGTLATLTGQGDNQVIYLRIPKQRVLSDLQMTRDDYVQWFQETLRDLCTKAGITMKLEETWSSSILLEYGRQFFLRGAQVSSALKRISRVSSEANQTIPSVNGDLAGMFSSCMSSAQKDHEPPTNVIALT
ncbi:hypothetical protein O0L34_g3646 [Tuta absoluta]|nr:hypothetical protein O0L34_g3646 [Tuta absoluta]